ncbi:hypothetical protein DFH28DRAFT_1196124, partial [Melampsora americana]
MEPQRYADQSYSDLFHRPFQRQPMEQDISSQTSAYTNQQLNQQLQLQTNGNHSNNLDQNSPFQLQDSQYTHGNNTQMLELNNQAQITQPITQNHYYNNQYPQQCEPLIDNRPHINHNLHSQASTLTNTNSNINQNQQLSVPQPQRPSAALSNSSSLVPSSLTGTSSSFFDDSETSVSTLRQKTNSLPLAVRGNLVSSNKKTSTRAKQSTQSKNATNPSQVNQLRQDEHDSSNKSAKEMVDNFLLPSSRLPNNITLPEQLTVAELYKLDASQLRKLADKYSSGRGKGVFSMAKKQYIRDFHISSEKLLAILCIHLGISQEVAANEIGRWASHRLSRNYDYFKKSQEVKAIYRASKSCISCYGGAVNPAATELVKQLWKSLSLEEKSAYGPKEDDLDPETDNTDIDDIRTEEGYVNPAEIPDNRPTQSGLATIVRGSNDEATRKNGFRTASRNMAFSKLKCEEFVGEFIKKANNLSRLHPVQFAIVAVSTHLSEHCFQYITTTPGLWEWAEDDLNTSATRESTTSRMQAFVTGRSVAGLARPKRSKGPTPETDKLKAHLNLIIQKATKKAQDTWKWSNCEARLAVQGFKLQYEPLNPVYKSWITKANCSLTEEKARQLNDDLISHPVSLIPIEKSGQNKKRRWDTMIEEEQEGLENAQGHQNDS